MPLYSRHCKPCDLDFEIMVGISEMKQGIPCVKCNGPTSHVFALRGKNAAEGRFPEGWWRDIAAKPLYISDKKGLREACRKHGCYAPGVLDG